MTAWTGIKWLHVFAGALWLGAAALVAFFILPAARKLGPAAGPAVGYIMNVRKLPTLISYASLLSLLTGLSMLSRFWPLDLGVIHQNVWGIGLILGVVAGVFAYAWGVLFQAPTAKKLSRITSQLNGPPSPDQQNQITFLQKRLQYGAYVGMALIIASLSGMILMHPI